MSTVPRYSTIQQILKRAFFPRERTITVFTEDKPSDRFLYSIILNRLSLNNIKINSIIPLGPKSQVIESSIRSGRAINNSLFIVDSDITLMEVPPIENLNLIGLNKYCIENYLCCESGIIEYLYPRIGADKKDIKTQLKFVQEVRKNLSPIVKLYHRYLLSFKFGCGCPFKKYDYFLKGSEPYRTLDKSILNQEIAFVETAIKNKIKESGVRSYSTEMKKQLNEIALKNPSNECTALKILSGKHQLFPLVRELIIRFDSTSRHLNTDQLKRLLAERFEIDQLDFIKDKIERLAH